MILVVVGIADAPPAGFHFAGEGGVLQGKAARGGHGLGPGGGAAQAPAGADKGFVPLGAGQGGMACRGIMRPTCRDGEFK